jgi:hypothetical protein
VLQQQAWDRASQSLVALHPEVEARSTVVVVESRRRSKPKKDVVDEIVVIEVVVENFDQVKVVSHVLNSLLPTLLLVCPLDRAK